MTTESYSVSVHGVDACNVTIYLASSKKACMHWLEVEGVPKMKWIVKPQRPRGQTRREQRAELRMKGQLSTSRLVQNRPASEQVE